MSSLEEEAEYHDNGKLVKAAFSISTLFKFLKHNHGYYFADMFQCNYPQSCEDCDSWGFE